MTEARFIAKNEIHWNSLGDYNKRLAKHRSVKGLTSDEVREFAHLFRLASHHLAYAKTHFPAGEVVPFLNQLVGVSHNFFYVRERSSISDVWRYFTHTFPQTVRDTWHYWVVATAIFVVAAIFMGVFVIGEPERIDMLLPGFSRVHAPDITDTEYREWDHAFMTAFFITNNTAVAFNAFVWGILGGIGSIFILAYNGLIVGGLMGFLRQGGANMTVAYALILPHGVIELLAIFLSGGAGLMLGKGLLFPGEFARRHSIVYYARQAITLIPGIVVMLIIAAIIEGYFTPLDISARLKLSFAVLTGILFVAYIAGTRQKQCVNEKL